jgi:hypothetical protein
MNGFLRRMDVGAIVFGVIVLVVGVYYFLSNTLGWNLGELNWDAIWPILVIGIGGSILLGAWRRASGTQ